MTNYFSHDYDAQNDIKLQTLVMEMDYAALGRYWCIVEMLYKQGGRIELSQNKAIAFALRTEVANIDQIISIVFEKDDKYFWSESILKRLRLQKEKSNKAKISVANKWNPLLNAKKRSKRLSEARKKASHTKKEWEEMKVFFRETCVKCFNESKLNGVVKDHIIPIYQGGNDGLDNIQPLCAKCNASKGADTEDYRLKYCLENNLEMPTRWISNAYEMSAIKEKKVKESKRNNIYLAGKRDEFLEELTNVLVTWNKTYGQNLRSSRSILDNYAYWREVYSLDEILESIKKSGKTWLAGKPIETFFRQKNPNGEKVDYISQALNFREEQGEGIIKIS